jgi:acyl-coenzyme A synthetase/AMP-(fatty) acid ligase
MRAEDFVQRLLKRATDAGTRIETQRGVVRIEDIEERIWAVSEGLSRAGLGTGDLVLIHDQRASDLFTDLLGTWAAGCIAQLTSEAPTGKAGDCGAGSRKSPPQLALFAGRQESTQPPLLAARVRAELEARRSAGTLPEDACYVTTTSGSTSAKRAILGSAQSLNAFLEWEAECLGVGCGDRVAAVTSPAFDVIYREILLPVISGATLVEPPDGVLPGQDVVAWLAESRVTVIHAVPSLARAWLRRSGQRRVSSSTALRWTIFAGEPLRNSVVMEWLKHCPENAHVMNLYGPSETTLARFYHIVSSTDHGRALLPVGRPLPNTSVAVIRDNAPASCGEPGQVVIKTSDGTYGYVGQVGATVSNPMSRTMEFVTGDLGVIDKEENLTVFGRIDSRLKRNGVWVDTEAVASVVEDALPDCEATLLVTGGESGHQLALFVNSQHPIDVRIIRRAVLARLGPASVPNMVITVPEWPRLPTGKVNRVSLLGMLTGKNLEFPPYGATSVNDIAVWIQQVAEQILGHSIGLDDGLLERGMSLEAAGTLGSVVGSAFGRTVPVSTIVTRHSSRGLAAWLLET